MEVTLEYLEDERKKLWAEVVKQTDISNKLLTIVQTFEEKLENIKTIAESNILEDKSIIRGIRNKTS